MPITRHFATLGNISRYLPLFMEDSPNEASSALDRPSLFAGVLTSLTCAVRRRHWITPTPSPATRQRSAGWSVRHRRLRHHSFADGSYYQFPALRWSFSNFRQLMPTPERLARLAAPSVLVQAPDRAIDALSFNTLTAISPSPGHNRCPPPTPTGLSCCIAARWCTSATLAC